MLCCLWASTAALADFTETTRQSPDSTLSPDTGKSQPKYYNIDTLSLAMLFSFFFWKYEGENFLLSVGMLVFVWFSTRFKTIIGSKIHDFDSSQCSFWTKTWQKKLRTAHYKTKWKAINTLQNDSTRNNFDLAESPVFLFWSNLGQYSLYSLFFSE